MNEWLSLPELNERFILAQEKQANALERIADAVEQMVPTTTVIPIPKTAPGKA